VRRFVPRTLAISQRATPGGDDLVPWALAASAAGVDAVQLREKDLGGLDLFGAVAAVVEAVGTTMTVLVNGRADVAVAAGAGGVHLPARGLPIALVRRTFPGLLLGASTHSLDEVAIARDAGADYVTFGPVYPPTSKRSALPPVGPSGLEAAARLEVPVLALGGVTVERLAAIAAAGAAGVAAIGAFQTPADASALAAAARRAFTRPAEVVER
jgi:thiamine-phosphate pyrophosphorylase